MRTAAVVVAATAVVSVAGSGTSSAHPGGSSGPIYTNKDTGRTVVAVKGHRFTVSLETETDSGEAWAFTARPHATVVHLVSKRVRPDRHKKGTVGFGSHTIYIFRAVGPGRTRMKLVERQPFDPERHVAHFSLTVRVKKAAD